MVKNCDMGKLKRPTLNQRVDDCRRDAEITVGDIADTIHVCPATYYRIVKDQRDLRWPEVQALCKKMPALRQYVEF